MRTSTVARLGALAFISVVVTITALDMRAPAGAPTTATLPAPTPVSSDPLRAELLRCQSIGTAAEGDGACLRAWAENRRRFLAPGARPQAAIGTLAPTAVSMTVANATSEPREPR
jgi:conjugative transfer region protein TrbK